MTTKTVYIEITNRCNFNCQTCYNRSGLNRQTKELSPEMVRTIISIFSQYGANRFLLSGGEPTLHSQFNKILDIVEEYPEYSFGFTTNGSCRDQRFIDILSGHENITLQVSLDGSCEEQNAKTRGAGNFQQALDFVTSVHNPWQKPLLKMVISRSNMEDVEEFFRLALSTNCIPEFAFIYRSGNAVDGWDQKMLTNMEKTKILHLIDRLNKEHNISAHLPLCTLRCPFINNMQELSLCIKTDGSVQPCQTLYDEAFTMANILQFDKEAFDKRAAEIQAMAAQRAQEDYGCARCMIRELCNGGCMAAAYLSTGDPLSCDGDCQLRKRQFLDFRM